MNLYPAIDIYEGEVVRLTRGDYAQKTVYHPHPEIMAEEWENQGAKWIHVVDLEGAKDGIPKNKKSIEAIRKKIKCNIQLGGGIRSLETIETLLDLGINRLVLGTKALDRNFFEKAMERFGSAIAVGLDIRDGKVQTQGWLEESRQTLFEALEIFNQTPLQTIIYTDISKDGMLQGPNFDGLKEVLKRSKSRIILSGGMSSLDDIKRCLQISEPNFEGPIIGKALYDKKFTLKEAANLVKIKAGA